MEESISFDCMTSNGVDRFEVIQKVGTLYLCQSLKPWRVQYFDARTVDQAVEFAKAAAKAEAKQPAEMIAGELISFEQDTLTDRFALALAQGCAARRGLTEGDDDFAVRTAPLLWQRAAALAAARPPQ